MISSLYFVAIGIWLAISIMEQRWAVVVAIVMLGFFGGVRYLAPRKLNKDSSKNLASLALLFAYLDSPYLVGDPKVKTYLLRLISELAVNTCKDRQVSYAMLQSKWVHTLSEAKKEVEKNHGNQSEDR